MVRAKRRTSTLILCVLIGTLLSAAACGKASNTIEQKGIPFDAYYLEQTVNFEDHGTCLLIDDYDQLISYISGFDQGIESGNADRNKYFSNIQKYDSTWFLHHQLLIVRLFESSGSYTHKVISVEQSPKNLVTIQRYIPAASSCDIKCWHIMIEIEKSFDATDKMVVYINDVYTGQ